MNFEIIRYILSYVMGFEALFLTLPCLISLIYQEQEGGAFFIVAFFCAAFYLIGTRKKPKNKAFYTREGFMTVALSWILLSIMGALPFVISGEIPSFIDAFFETVSGFTTTGASILSDVEALSHTCLFWRSFTHWIGGMGVLVFILAIVPLSGSYNIYLMRAESPGPSVGKLVPRIKNTAKILYLIYLAMTVIQIILLLVGKMPLFDAVTTAFGTAGTGGFGIKADSLAGYSTYIQMVTTIFMILFGVNFNVYYLIVMKRWKEAFSCEEMRYYFGIITATVILITWNIRGLFENGFKAFHAAVFQVASIITTTGFSTEDFDQWPEFSKGILVVIMFVGACAGSTGGGIKVSRFVIIIKTFIKEIFQFLHPRSIKIIRFEGKKVEHNVLRSINTYFAAYMLIFVGSVLIICLNDFDLVTNFTAVAATLNNIGPGLEIVGPTGHFGDFNVLSKVVLSFDMLAGRLELFPLLLLFVPDSWKK